MFNKTTRKFAVAMIALSTVVSGTAFAGSNMAQDEAMVNLKSLDGTLNLVGELTGLEYGYYNINVKGFGLMRIDADEVTCKGDACPVKS